MCHSFITNDLDDGGYKKSWSVGNKYLSFTEIQGLFACLSIL